MKRLFAVRMVGGYLIVLSLYILKFLCRPGWDIYSYIQQISALSLLIGGLCIFNLRRAGLYLSLISCLVPLIAAILLRALAEASIWFIIEFGLIYGVPIYISLDLITSDPSESAALIADKSESTPIWIERDDWFGRGLKFLAGIYSEIAVFMNLTIYEKITKWIFFVLFISVFPAIFYVIYPPFVIMPLISLMLWLYAMPELGIPFLLPQCLPYLGICYYLARHLSKLELSLGAHIVVFALILTLAFMPIYRFVGDGVNWFEWWRKSQKESQKFIEMR